MGDLVTLDKPIRLELIRIPAGEFLMGDDKRTVDVAEFYIGKYPVTNAQYAAFVQAKDHNSPSTGKTGASLPARKIIRWSMSLGTIPSPFASG